jgi:curved DNA-binding protein CbpA
MFYNHYSILNIPVDSNQETIKKSFDDKVYYMNQNHSKISHYYEMNLYRLKNAYAILMDENRRKLFDQDLAEYLNNTNPSTKLKLRSDYIPFIDYFIVNPNEANIGDTVTIKWKTTNCDQVILLPFGPVEYEGERSKVIHTSDDLLIEIVLLVENTLNSLNEKMIHPINRNSYIKNVEARIEAMKLETQLLKNNYLIGTSKMPTYNKKT